MNPIDNQNLDSHAADAFAWRYGMLGLADLNDTSGRSNSDDGAGRSIATGGLHLLAGVDMTLQCTLAGIEAIRGLLGIAKGTLDSWLEQSGNTATRMRWTGLWDNLLDQIVDVAKQSGVGEVNLLHSSSGVLRIPFFNVSVHANGEEHHFFTLGVGIHRIMGEGTDSNTLQGLVVVSPKAHHGVCWLEALGPWAAELESDVDLEFSAREQHEILAARIDQFEGTLNLLGSQLHTFRDCFDECTRVVL
jgi:hypothetical protein